MIALVRGDPVVLQAGEHARAVGVDVGLHVLVVEIPPNVPVELAVERVAGVAGFRRPDLARRLDVARKGGDAELGKHRRVHAEAWARIGVLDPVRVDDEPTQVRLGKVAIETGRVGALGQPDPPRPAAKDAGVLADGSPDVPAHHLGALHEHGEERVRAGAGGQLDNSGVLETRKLLADVSPEPAVEAEQTLEALVVPVDDRPEPGVAPGPLLLFLQQIEQGLEVSLRAVAEHVVAEHRRERWTDVDGEARRHPVVLESPEHLDQGQVGLRDRLEEPVLLHVEGQLRMPNPRQVGMQDDAECAPVHGILRPAREPASDDDIRRSAARGAGRRGS